MWRRRTVRFGGVLLLLVAIWIVASVLNDVREQRALLNVVTCYTTGGDELRICHAVANEHVFYQPSKSQIAYNTQIVALGNARYATVLHSESKDMARYHAATNLLRPGDSIKTGLVDAAADPGAALRSPAALNFRIWGSLSDPRSPLYYAFEPSNPKELGLSGGANPMVVRGRRSMGDPYDYVFFLGVTSDDRHGLDWRNVLLQARTRDFLTFDLLQRDAANHPEWVPFAGDGAMPTIVVDVTGHPIESNQPAPVETGATGDKLRPAGAVVTAGIFGSIALVSGTYYYFYTDQDPVDPKRNHLYVRTARDISTDGAWSAPLAVLDMPPEILVRVLNARTMDRWAIFYNCLRSLRPFVSDICLQYTTTLDLTGPGGLGGLTLFDGPGYTGVSHYALGLVGQDKQYTSGAFLKIQQFAMTDEAGGLTVPTGLANDHGGGIATWTDLSRSDFNIFGAPVYQAGWTVEPINH